MASTPANGPSPTAATKTRARISVSMPRSMLKKPRVSPNTEHMKELFCVRLWAARNDSGIANIAARKVPISAISIVMSISLATSLRALPLGGQERSRKSSRNGQPSASRWKQKSVAAKAGVRVDTIAAMTPPANEIGSRPQLRPPGQHQSTPEHQSDKEEYQGGAVPARVHLTP